MIYSTICKIFKEEVTMQIREFQRMMKTIYFSKDLERGLFGTYEWLADEVKELGDALEGTDKIAIEKEFADVIAWLASLANLIEIDLEKAALNKYQNKCPKCQQSICRCS
jgi:NTP pyrophosphatase (non-canonical NTP hydrolase)